MSLLLSNSGKPRPAIRLLLTSLLGLVGACLVPCKHGFFIPLPSPTVGWGLTTWLLLAWGGLAGLYRLEQARVPRILRPVFLVSLAGSLLLLRPTPERPMLVLGLLGLTLLSMLLAQAWHLRAMEPASAKPSPLRCLALSGHVALAAPLLLFAARPEQTATPSVWRSLQRAGYTLLLLFLVSPVLQLGRDYWPDFVSRIINMDALVAVGTSFGLWAWFSCAMLFLVGPQGPWPVRIERAPAALLPGRMTAGLLLVCSVVLALSAGSKITALLAYTMFGLLITWPFLMIANLIRPVVPGFRLTALSPARAMGPIESVAVMGMALIPFMEYASRGLTQILTGKFLAMKFSPDWLGWALDQSFLPTIFFRFTFLTAQLVPLIVVARWLSNREHRPTRIAVAATALIVLASWIAYLILPSYGLILYVENMGFTPLRALGLAYGLSLFTALLAFTGWCLRRW